MLFNSYVFIFAYLPVVLFGFYWVGKFSHHFASLWLVSASLFFYGWWNAHFVGLLLASTLFNYCAAYLISHRISQQSVKQAKLFLICTITANLLLLGYYKYANFFIDNLNHLAGTSLFIGEILLPLGISFFTFTQIAFLVDTYQGKVKEFNFIHYTLFVTYFPHLIAGPVLHHNEMMPQFAKRNSCHLNWNNLAVGYTIFVLGLAKKVLIADSLAEFSSPIFNAIKAGGQPMFFESWVGALAYTLQLYFDFSAYSDMAIGLSLMFNVRLPMNFNSPYKASSIIEFWRRWHMTLSRFLRDYLYIPMGGSRHGKTRRYLNLMTTMLLGGLWHGAGWTFVIWGGLHGFYLIVNHAWRGLKNNFGWKNGGVMATFAASMLTFLAVVTGWVFFRADSFASATTMLYGMAGMNGVSLPISLSGQLGKYFPPNSVVYFGILPLTKLSITKASATLIVGLAIVWGLPNVQEMHRRYHSVYEDLQSENKPYYVDHRWINHLFEWKPTKAYALITGILFTLAIFNLTRVREFLYFQF